MEMEVKTALDKFYEYFDKPCVDNVCFEYGKIYYMLSYCGRFIITEDLESEDEREYCFGNNGKELIEAMLDSKVNKTNDKSIREILLELPPEKLLV